MGFGDQVADWEKKANALVRLAHQKIATEAFSRVIMMSPVDTGRFRGNWQVAIGNIPNGTLDLNDPTGTAALGSVSSEVEKLQAGETIYLVNNMPYARRLEYGWSKQAPGGMVRLTVQQFQPIVKQVVEQLNTKIAGFRSEG